MSRECSVRQRRVWWAEAIGKICSLRLFTATFGRNCSGDYPLVTNAVFFLFHCPPTPQKSVKTCRIKRIKRICSLFNILHRRRIAQLPEFFRTAHATAQPVLDRAVLHTHRIRQPPRCDILAVSRCDLNSSTLNLFFSFIEHTSPIECTSGTFSN